MKFALAKAQLVLGIHILSKSADRHHLDFSLEDGAIGHYPRGLISIANTNAIFLSNTNHEVPDDWTQRYISKMYADVSISYEDTKAPNLGPQDKYQLEELNGGWRYNVC